MQAQNETIVKFSENLRNLMKLQGLNSVALAKDIGVTHVAVGNYLKGRLPKPEILARIARRLDVSVEDLLEQANAKPVPDRLQLEPMSNARTSSADLVLLTRANERAVRKAFDITRMSNDDVITAYRHFVGAANHAPKSMMRLYVLIRFVFQQECRRRMKI